MTTKKQPTDKKQPTTDQTQPTVETDKIDINELIGKLSHLPLIQTKHLTQLMGFNDGGKYLRRHLRKHFADLHLWGDSWVWKHTDNQLFEIMEYFVDNQQIFNETKRLTIGSLIPNHDITKLEIK